METGIERKTRLDIEFKDMCNLLKGSDGKFRKDINKAEIGKIVKENAWIKENGQLGITIGD
jgi:hypothetical protein